MMETEKKENQKLCDCCEWRMGLSEIAEAIGSQSNMEAVLKINPDLVRAVLESGLEQHLRAARIASCGCHALADESRAIAEAEGAKRRCISPAGGGCQCK